MRALSLTDISISNLKRRRGRSAFLILSLSLAIAMFVGITGAVESMQADLGRKMDEFGANLVVMPNVLEAPISYGGIVIGNALPESADLDEMDVAKIRTIRNKENINVVAPKLMGRVTINGKAAIVVGVLFDEELKIKQWWELEGERPVSTEQVMLGYRAAIDLQAAPGSTVNINDRDFTVAAIVRELLGPEDSYVYADLHRVQDLLGKPGKVSLIEVSAWCSNCPIENIVAQTAEKLPHAKVTAVKQAISAKQAAVGVVSKFSLMTTGVVIVVAALIVFSVMMAAVSERTREIGLFRALGYRQKDIVRILITEAEIASLTAGVIGFVVGMLVSRLVITWIVGWQAELVWSGLIAFEAILIAAVAGGIGSAYPALQAAKLDPAAALRAL